jgi:hypothetical protein
LPNHKVRARGGIPKPSLAVQTQPFRFSFKHLDPDHPKFPLKSCDREFLCGLINCLTIYSQRAQEDFRDQNNNEHRHVIDFAQTSEKEGFTSAPGIDGDQLAYLEAWQFEVRFMTNWRAHGFIGDDTFFIVWLDPLHRLYPLPGIA